MSDPQAIQQIEYRWQDRRDLSPIASSMSEQSTRGWDARIRGWVRHPSTGKPEESVRYQILPNGYAAIAWRYWDKQVAQLEDGTHGRPLVSRVLVGLASVLSPDRAIMLCRTGLPAAAGQRAGQVKPAAEMTPVSVGDLAPEDETVANLDRNAAFETGLRELVAVALSDPGTPLAISIPQPLMSRAPGDGVQPRLLWGLWRLTRPLLGPVRRDWSFSTFEAPLGEVDPRTLPDIVFRLPQPANAAPPTTPRKELKVRPGVSALPPESDYTKLAEWLVAEYRENGASGLALLIEKCCTEHALSARLAAAYQLLSDKWAAALAPSLPVKPGPASEAEAEPEPAGVRPLEAPEAAGGETGPAGQHNSQFPDTLPDIPVIDETLTEPPVRPARSQAPDPLAVSLRADKTAPRLLLPDRAQDTQGAADQGGLRRASGRRSDYLPAASLSALLDLLRQARDPGELQSILSQILAPGTVPDAPDRRTARSLMAENDFFLSACAELGVPLPLAGLAGIFGKIVIPELDRKTVRTEIADWAYRADPPVVGALILAARSSGADDWREMQTIVQREVTRRWLEDNDLPIDLEGPPAAAGTPPPPANPGRIRGFFKLGSP